MRVFSNRIAIAVYIGQRALYRIGVADRIRTVTGDNDFRANGYRFLSGCTATVIVIEVYIFIDIRILLNVLFLHVCVFGAIKMEATARSCLQLSDCSYIRISIPVGYIGDTALDWCCTAISIRHCSTYRNIRHRAVLSSLRIGTDGNIAVFCMRIVT